MASIKKTSTGAFVVQWRTAEHAQKCNRSKCSSG